jgi:membrane protease subunit HflK
MRPRRFPAVRAAIGPTPQGLELCRRLAKGYRQQTVADAVGQTMRFGKVLDEWKKAPDVKRTRLYLETMERVLSSAEKIIIDSNIVVPFISLMPPHKKK